MAAANKGDGWTLDISNARSGGSTESNRERAARGGFSFTMPSEPGQSVTGSLDAAEVDRLLNGAATKGRPWLAGVGAAREVHHVTLPNAGAFLAALDALVRERDVDGAVETFRRVRQATGPTWLRPALERAARELPGPVPVTRIR